MPITNDRIACERDVSCFANFFKVWLISCTLFVFLALMEYFIVLFGIRYDKHWRAPPPTSKSLVSTFRHSPSRIHPTSSSSQGINREVPVSN